MIRSMEAREMVSMMIMTKANIPSPMIMVREVSLLWISSCFLI